MFQDSLVSREAVIADVQDFFRRHWKAPAGLRRRPITG
jgi:hypothetical protein